MRLVIFCTIICLMVSCRQEPVDLQPVPQRKVEQKYHVFRFKKYLTLPGKPEVIYDAISGDISGWWDHCFSEKPYKLYLEPKPGGGFYEIFNKNGDGVKHATVIYAERPKLLRFDGPLGLSGKAVQIVTTYKFEPFGTDSTQFMLEVHGAGELDNGLPKVVEQVWEHFIFDRFKPYIEKNKHLESVSK